MTAGSMAHTVTAADSPTSAGERWTAERESVAALYKVFNGNARELLAHFARHASPSAAFDLRDPTRPGRSQAFLDETGRLLHNCLAAAASFADRATEVWRGQVAQNSPHDSPRAGEFERCVAGLVTDSPLAHFLCGLSKFSADGRLPLLSGKIEFVAGERAGRACVTTLDRELLRAWDGWDTRAEEFLSRSDEPLRLDALVTAHAAAVEEFNCWLSGAWDAPPAAHGELNREAGSFPPLELVVTAAT